LQPLEPARKVLSAVNQVEDVAGEGVMRTWGRAVVEVGGEGHLALEGSENEGFPLGVGLGILGEAIHHDGSEEAAGRVRHLDLLCPSARIGSLSPMKVREVLRVLRDDGWQEVATRGSHLQLKHSTKPGRVTVAGHPSDDLAPGTLKSILVQAGLKEQ